MHSSMEAYGGSRRRSHLRAAFMPSRKDGHLCRSRLETIATDAPESIAVAAIGDSSGDEES